MERLERCDGPLDGRLERCDEALWEAFGGAAGFYLDLAEISDQRQVHSGRFRQT